METNIEKGTASPIRAGRTRQTIRVLRPLQWWLLLVMVLYGIRLHGRWMERTRLSFSATLEGRSVEYEANSRLDGRAILSGQRISLGPHMLTIAHSKTESFSTNLFIWYGGKDVGGVDLKRAKGTLEVLLNRPARRLSIRGPEFGIVLTNSSGGTWLVPTDHYDVEARFAFATVQDQATILANSATVTRIASQFGTARLTSNGSLPRLSSAAINAFICVISRVIRN